MGFLSQDPQALVIHLMCGMRGGHVKIDMQISFPNLFPTHKLHICPVIFSPILFYWSQLSDRDHMSSVHSVIC